MEQNAGLHHPSFEFDSCGIGFVANIKGNKTHKSISDALTILENMKHRGACGYEKDTGDGAGIMCQIPHEFFYSECEELGIRLPPAGKYAVGVVFLPKSTVSQQECFDVFSRTSEKLNLRILGYRKVPVHNKSLGSSAIKTEPDIYQVFISDPDNALDENAFERKLFVLRKHITHIITTTFYNDRDFYIASLSAKKIVYKGQLTSEQLRDYFPDLNNHKFVSAFGLVHSRFSTNTMPEWSLAQPFRFIAHNGEINTLQGNLNWLGSREKNFITNYFTQQELDMLIPIVSRKQSDSACLDNLIELLTLSGRSLPHVMMMLIPESWEDNQHMSAEKKAFYEFHSCLVEPWDGPAAIAFTDGETIGATLDRNGLRPARYWVTHDDRVILASESGVLVDLDPSNIKEKGMLRPGQMFIVDFALGKIIGDKELKHQICTSNPYKEWLNTHKIRLSSIPSTAFVFPKLTPTRIIKYYKAFGYTSEDIERIIATMAIEGKEPIGSMGNDTPLAILSNKPQHLSNYFKQLFAQVTNPSIDSIRERGVMSLATFVGSIGNLLVEKAEDCHVLELAHPILDEDSLNKVRCIDTRTFQSRTLYMYFNADNQPGSMERGLQRLCRYAKDAIEEGFKVLILSDRDIDSRHAAIPSLLAASAVHQYLVQQGLRGKVGIVVEAGDVWEIHHMACLIGFGVNAICPYLVFASIENMHTTKKYDCNLDLKQLKNNYIKASNDGLLKVFSKMGISTLQSYLGAQVFEVVGISEEVTKRYFKGVVSRIGGIDLDGIAEEVLAKHRTAFLDADESYLLSGGVYQWRSYGEKHSFNPDTIALLQHAAYQNDYTVYKKYAKLVNDGGDNPCTLRGLFEFKRHLPQIAISEVEPAEEILKRFATGAMSFGSISWEAHTTLAIAMNRIGAKSNTGEGGEDESRYDTLPNGDSLRSSIKQIASGRFGVNSRYLTEADELQIKLAQGSKPGEGGQIPGEKVDEWIGKTRYSTPGVGLISPPPHHDIYSIEDLAQLIFDLKSANRNARISVKLVSKAGVGTIAAGVAKAKSDVILISGYDGGTGASPIGSIRHAGLPWEMGLAETHQTLVRNKLRERVILQADGQLKTGRDIAVATLLGAEEWGVATAALVVEGCVMMRKCHMNTCPVGIATQNPELRKRFNGTPERIINFFYFLVEELREIMAYLGFRTINEMVGQANCLKVRDDLANWKHKSLNLDSILYFNQDAVTGLYKQQLQDHGLDNVLDLKLIEIATPAIYGNEKVSAEFVIKNTDLAVGTMLGNEITKQYKSTGLAEDSICFKFMGTAGQSFGAFTTSGMSLELEGDANDYFGKGLSGAKLIVYPPKQANFKAHQNIIIGNVAFYGATDGFAYVNGLAGNRFAVRNSGASLIVEGVGDNCCEYMTGGCVVVLGEVGKNFAAGMSGGIAYIYDAYNTFDSLCNMELVDIDPVDKNDCKQLHQMLTNHSSYTSSSVAQDILADFDNVIVKFKKVFPREYKKILAKKNVVEKVNNE